MIKSIIIIFILCLPVSILAFDEMTDHQMEEVTGQGGMNIFLEDSTELTVELQDLRYGDLDGRSGETPGFLVLKGYNAQGGAGVTTLTFELKDALFAFDLGTSGGGGYSEEGNQVVLANRSFVKVGLPRISDIIVTLNLPAENEIILQNDLTGTNKYSLGGLVLTPITVEIKNIYSDLFIASH